MSIVPAHATASRGSTPRATNAGEPWRAFVSAARRTVFQNERQACGLHPVLTSSALSERTLSEIAVRLDALAVLHFAITLRALRMIADTMQNEKRHAFCMSRMARALLRLCESFDRD